MWDRLSNIKVPTLVIGGIYDEMNPEDIRKEGELIPNSRTYLCPNGSHLSMYDGKIGVPDHPLPIFVDHHIFLSINMERWSDCSGEDWSKCPAIPQKY